MWPMVTELQELLKPVPDRGATAQNLVSTTDVIVLV